MNRTLLLSLCLIACFAWACGPADSVAESESSEESMVDDEDPVLDGKSDSITKSVLIQGSVSYGAAIDSKFQGSRHHGYTFKAKKGATIAASLDGDPAQKTDTVLRVYGPRNATSWGGTPIAKNDNSGGTKFSAIANLVLPSEGEYLVVASCKNTSYTGKTYSLELLCNQASGCEASSSTSKGEIGLEVDFVGSQRFVPGTIQMLKDYFGSIGYKLTIVEDEELPPVSLLQVGKSSKAVQDYYKKNFGHRGQKGWHYLLMADSLDGGMRGWGLMNGDVFAIGIDYLYAYPNAQAAAQAHVIMHELGHNLGLTHEGFDEEASSGKHNGGTCASASFPKGDIPITSYSPACIAHINLNSIHLID